MISKPLRIILACSIAGALSVAAPNPLRAQPILNRVLKGSRILEAGKCAKISIQFNRRISYQSHFPLRMGQSVAIRLQLVGNTADEDDDLAPEAAAREALPTARIKGAGVRSAALDLNDGSRPVLRVQFDGVKRYQVSQGKDFRSLELRVWSADETGCGGGSKGGRSDSDTGGSKNSLADARRALKAGNYKRAIALLTRLAGSGDAKTARTAQEFLGLARERNDQFAHAKAEYKRYLKKYPKGRGATRVRQRLKALVAARSQNELKRLDTKRGNRDNKVAAAPPKKPKQTDTPQGTVVQEDRKGDLQVPETNALVQSDPPDLKQTLPEEDDNGWSWQVNGSVSQFYYRSDSFGGKVPLTGSYDNRQNELVTAGDLSIDAENEVVEARLRFSGYNEQGLQSDDKSNRSKITSAYSEIIVKDTGLSGSIGRRRSSSSGVYGRYDGAKLAYEFNPGTTVKAIVGSPVYYGNYDKPFADDRYFYGASVEQKLLDDSLTLEGYFLEQNVGSVLDRRAVGGEVRYASGNINGFSGADYDIHFNEFNSAFVNATYIFDNGSTIYSTVDFRRVPFLLTSNALIGQNVDDLSTLVDLFSLEEVYNLALDRTATSKSAMVGYSHKFSDDWQAVFDATVAEYSGTVTSGGVDGIPAPGTEIYVGARLNGANVLVDQDQFSVGMRYIDTSTYNMALLDSSYRRYISDDWRMLTRFRVAYRDWDELSRQQLIVIPSVRLNYQLDKNWSFESELGARWEHNMGADYGADNTDALVTAGYRYQF